MLLQQCLAKLCARALNLVDLFALPRKDCQYCLKTQLNSWNPIIQWNWVKTKRQVAVGKKKNKKFNTSILYETVHFKLNQKKQKKLVYKAVGSTQEIMRGSGRIKVLARHDPQDMTRFKGR